MLTAAIMAVQAAKNNHPALERNESLKVMEVIPHQLSSTPSPEPARGGQRASRRQLLLRQRILIPPLFLLPAPIARQEKAEPGGHGSAYGLRGSPPSA